MEVAVAAMAGSTAFGVYSKLEQGKDLQEIANARAAVDRADAAAVARQTLEKAKIKRRRGEELIASQKARFAASGVRVDTGSPLVVEAQTRADILKDVGFILEQGSTERERYFRSATLEEKRGKKLRRRSMWDAVTTGLRGVGSIAYLGSEAGWFDGGGGGSSTAHIGGYRPSSGYGTN